MTDSHPHQLPLVWEKARILSIIIATLAIPLLVAYLGNSYSSAQKQDELAARYVELAIGILRAEPTEDSRALRGWAIVVINHFSQVPLSKEVQDELRFRAFEKDVRAIHSHVESVLQAIQPGSQASVPLTAPASSNSHLGKPAHR